MLIKKIALSAILPLSLFASIDVSGIEIGEGYANFREPILNTKVSMVPGCISLREAATELSKQTGYEVDFTKTLLDMTYPVCNLNLFPTAGRVLEAITANRDMSFNVIEETNRYAIVVQKNDFIVTTFPPTWDTSISSDLLKTRFPEVKWKFYGNVVEARGTKEQMKNPDLVQVLSTLRAYASRSLPVNVEVARINKEEAPMSYLLNNGIVPNQIYLIEKIQGLEPQKVYKASVRHTDSIHVAGVPLPVRFDLQRNSVRMGEQEIPFSEANGRISFMYNNLQISVEYGNSPFYNSPVK